MTRLKFANDRKKVSGRRAEPDGVRKLHEKIMKPLLLVAMTLATQAITGCGSSPPRTTTPTKKQAASGDAKPAESTGNSGLHATVIATVAEGTLGPYVAFGPKRAIAMYAPPGEAGRRWVSQLLDARGKPAGSPRDVGPAPNDTPFAVLRPSTRGYVGLWVRLVGQANVLEGIVLDEDGSPRGDVIAISQAKGDVLWADAFERRKGVLVLWAEQTGDRARVMSQALGADGKLVGSPSVVTNSARAWQALTVPSGVALAVVEASDQEPAVGSVSLLRIDDAGARVGQPTAVSTAATARLDVDMVRVGDSLLIAWTDVQGGDSTVFAAAADLNGRVLVAPRAPLAPHGDQALLGLVQPSTAGARALVVFEDLPGQAQGPRNLRLATLDAWAVASDRTATLAFESTGGDAGDIAAAPDGFLMMSASPVCTRASGCGDRSVPWYVRLRENLALAGSAPLLLDALDGKAPAVAWAPGCIGQQCFALAVGDESPARLVTVALNAGPIALGAPATAEPPATPPRLTSNRTVHMSAEPLADIASARTATGSIVGWISHFVDGPEARDRKPPPNTPGDPTKPMEAEIGLQILAANGTPTGTPAVLSVRAYSPGGIAIAPTTAGDEVAVAWVARDFGDPQVFVTRFGQDGKRLGQRMLTRAKGEAADVAIARFADGWIVSWVDWRHGNGEVFAVRVNRALVPIGPEKRITNAQGDASDVALLVMGDEVLVGYGDTRDSTGGLASPFVQKLVAATLERVGEERRVIASTLHARDVQLARTNDGVVMAWLADRMPTAESEQEELPGARLARIDPSTLRIVGQSVDLPSENAVATTVGFGCEGSACRGMMSVRADSGYELEAFAWNPAEAGVVRARVARLNGPAAADVRPEVGTDTVIFADRGVSGGDRVRRAVVQWSRQ